MHTTEKFTRLVVMTTAFGFFCLRSPVTAHKWLTLAPVLQKALSSHYVHDPSVWMVSDCSPALRHDANGTAASAEIGLQAAGYGGSLLVMAARRGLRSMTVSHMKKLYDFLQVPPPARGGRPSTEVPLVQALVVHILGDSATDVAVQNALKARGRVGELPGMDKVSDLITPEMTEMIFEDADTDDSDIRNQCEEIRLAKERAPLSRHLRRGRVPHVLVIGVIHTVLAPSGLP